MMRLVVCAGALGLAACASGGAAPEGGLRSNGPLPSSSTYGPQSANGNHNGQASGYTTSDLGMQTYVSVPLDTAYTALKKAYLSLGLEITTQDAGAHVVGNDRVSVRHKMLGRNLSAFFNCGLDAATGWPRADHYQVVFSVVSTLSNANAGRTRVVTLVTGQASDLATSASAVYCSSTGLMETTLLKTAGYQAD
jgi:hypothetical protein